MKHSDPSKRKSTRKHGKSKPGSLTAPITSKAHRNATRNPKYTFQPPISSRSIIPFKPQTVESVMKRPVKLITDLRNEVGAPIYRRLPNGAIVSLVTKGANK